MDLRQHESWVKLLELLARELQVQRPLPYLRQAKPVYLRAFPCADPTLEEIRLAALLHLEKLLKLLKEVPVVEAVGHELILA